MTQAQAPTTVTATIDGNSVTVPKGTLLIRAAEQVGIAIPRFCDHPLLAPVGACRQCLVDIEGQRKPMASCTIEVTEGMVVRTQHTSAAAESAQRGVMELLLINHPLDCPVCDKGGECPLQNQAMSAGRAESRFTETKRTFPKPIPISPAVLLDRERCVLCARCTRFAQQIAGDPFIELLDRGALQQVGTFAEQPFESHFSGNTVQICPVGALTSQSYRFRARPFDLVSTPSTCEHCASGCAQRTDHRRGKVMRRLAGDDPAVNEEWNCDKGRWGFAYATEPSRIRTPLVRNTAGVLEQASWAEAIAEATRGLIAAGGDVGVLTGGHLTLEDYRAYTAFAKNSLGTNAIDFRARAHSAEETDFLRWYRPTLTYTELETASTVILVGFEPEDESPIVFLRLRKAAHFGVRVISVASHTSRGSHKLGAEVRHTVPGHEPATLRALADELGSGPGVVVLAGERLASVRGGLSAVAELATKSGYRVGWIPRRAGELGAIAAGMLPGGDTSGAGASLADMFQKPPTALITAGIDPTDVPATFERPDFLISLELLPNDISARADVVFPVAAVAEKSGTFVNWEGRERPFAAALPSDALPDARILAALAHQLDRPFESSQMQEPTRASAPQYSAEEPAAPGPGQAVLDSWRLLIDDGVLQVGAQELVGTAPKATIKLADGTAREIGVESGGLVEISHDGRTIALPLQIADLPERVVWLPMKSPGSHLYSELGALPGTVVELRAGER